MDSAELRHHWGSGTLGALPLEKKPCRFELMLARSGLMLASDAEIALSPAMESWARKHHRERYVPEKLLKVWGLTGTDD